MQSLLRTVHSESGCLAKIRRLDLGFYRVLTGEHRRTRESSQCAKLPAHRDTCGGPRCEAPVLPLQPSWGLGRVRSSGGGHDSVRSVKESMQLPGCLRLKAWEAARELVEAMGDSSTMPEVRPGPRSESTQVNSGLLVSAGLSSIGSYMKQVRCTPQPNDASKREGSEGLGC